MSQTILRDAYAALVLSDGREVSARNPCRLILDDNGGIKTDRTIRLEATQSGVVVVRFFTTRTLTNGDHVANGDESFSMEAGDFLDYGPTF